MAKKRNKKAQPQQHMSPIKYIREKARSLPIGKCYLNSNWNETGLAQVVVTRVRPSGNLVVGMYLVDTFCLGVKDALYNDNITEEELMERLEEMDTTKSMEEVDYVTAHNLIYGAISFADEAGINPAKDFAIPSLILEEDTDDIPLEEFEFGKNGKYLLYIGPDGKERKYLRTLRDKLGDDFDFIMPADIGSDYEDEEDDSVPLEDHTYYRDDYPTTLEVKNQWIADELLSSDTPVRLPVEFMERVFALPADEAAADIGAVLLYAIGKYLPLEPLPEEEPNPIESYAVLHSLILLAHIDSDKGLPAVMELMRLDSGFAVHHLGENYVDYVSPALFITGRRHLDEIEEYLITPGFDTFMRIIAMNSLAMMVVAEPETRGEVIELLRRVLSTMPERLPHCDACDQVFATMSFYALEDIKARELLPEIKAICDTGYFNENEIGSYKDIEARILSDGEPTPYYSYPTLEEQCGESEDDFS